jgi:hypothetical protein
MLAQGMLAQDLLEAGQLALDSTDEPDIILL